MQIFIEIRVDHGGYVGEVGEQRHARRSCLVDFILLYQVSVLCQPVQIYACILEVEVCLVDYPGLARSVHLTYVEYARYDLKFVATRYLYTSKVKCRP
jgi:hypothetical protein